MSFPDICRIDENNIKQFNAALMNDGYDYELNIKYLEYDEYSQKLESTLAAGKTDVAFLGLGDENGNNPAYDLISSNLVLISMMFCRKIRAITTTAIKTPFFLFFIIAPQFSRIKIAFIQIIKT